MVNDSRVIAHVVSELYDDDDVMLQFNVQLEAAWRSGQLSLAHSKLTAQIKQTYLIRMAFNPPPGGGR